MSRELFIIKRNPALPKDISMYYDWIKKEIDSTDPSLYDDCNVLCNPLRKCYLNMLNEFPAMNGRDRTEEDELIDSSVDYCLTRNVIEISCGWFQFENVYPKALEYSRNNDLTVYNILTFKVDGTNHIIERHCADVYLSIPKSIIKSLPVPLFIFVFCFGGLWTLKLIITSSTLSSIPPFSLFSILTFKIIFVFSTIISLVFLFFSFRNEYRGHRVIRDVVIDEA